MPRYSLDNEKALRLAQGQGALTIALGTILEG